MMLLLKKDIKSKNEKLYLLQRETCANIHRRTLAALQHQLPPKLEVVICVRLSDNQRLRLKSVIAYAACLTSAWPSRYEALCGDAEESPSRDKKETTSPFHVIEGNDSDELDSTALQEIGNVDERYKLLGTPFGQSLL